MLDIIHVMWYAIWIHSSCYSISSYCPWQENLHLQIPVCVYVAVLERRCYPQNPGVEPCSRERSNINSLWNKPGIHLASSGITKPWKGQDHSNLQKCYDDPGIRGKSWKCCFKSWKLEKSNCLWPIFPLRLCCAVFIYWWKLLLSSQASMDASKPPPFLVVI